MAYKNHELWVKTFCIMSKIDITMLTPESGLGMICAHSPTHSVSKSKICSEDGDDVKGRPDAVGEC
jgi:hypothetical protein